MKKLLSISMCGNEKLLMPSFDFAPSLPKGRARILNRTVCHGTLPYQSSGSWEQPGLRGAPSLSTPPVSRPFHAVLRLHWRLGEGWGRGNPLQEALFQKSFDTSIYF